MPVHSDRSHLRRRSPAVVACALVVVLASVARAAPDNLRILTYNTAFMYLQADASGPVPGPPCVTSCDPLELPPFPLPCFCSSITWPVNRFEFADVEEKTRALKIAERIVATDQDVVVLNEVFDPVARAVFVEQLAKLGPYKHYVSLLRGKAPIQFSSLDAIPGIADVLPDFPSFMLPYEPLNNDSGLMIFSKYRFEKLGGAYVPNDADCGSDCGFAGYNNGLPLQPGFFAFRTFDTCGTFDCLASKGVGLVKVATPRGPAYVAFTHLQTESDYSAERRAQYEVVAKTIIGAIPSRELPGAAVYLVGDLNTSGRDRLDAQSADSQEWHDLFNPDSNNANVADGFFACANGVDTGNTTEPCRYGTNGRFHLTDSWGFETSTSDEGIFSRLDYILHSSRLGRLCMQHIMRAWDLLADAEGDGGAVWLSDHYPIRGDFGLSGRYCSPNDDPDAALPYRNVRPLVFGPTNCTEGGAGGNPICDQEEVVSPPEASLASAGNFQWFVIEQAGTYSIKVTPYDSAKRVKFAVYHHTDLSRPVMPFDETVTDRGITYAMPSPPYYVRTFAVDAAGQPDRTIVGAQYSLRVHQHLCREPQDACALEPGLALTDPYSYVWPQTAWNDPLTEVRDLWWRFKTSGTSGGKLVSGADAAARYPTVKMQPEAPAGDSFKCLTSVEPVVEVWDDPIFPSQLLYKIPFIDVQVDQDDDWDDDGLQDDLRVAPELPASVDGKLETYLLRVTRDSSFLDSLNPCNAGMTSYVSYHTDLTYMVPLRVQMWAELDDDVNDEDNMRIFMAYDAGGFVSYPPSSSSVHRNFDEPDQTQLSGNEVLRGYYVAQTWPTFWETDEHEYLRAWAPYQTYAGIAPLSGWYPTSGESFDVLADGPNGSDADYYYYFYYTLCHDENAPACKNPPVPTP